MDVDELVLIQMVQKDYVIFAPKSERDLRKDYAELWDYADIARLTPSEVLFVWWYACPCSPIIALPEEKRFPLAIDRSFKGAQREDRKQRYAPTGQAPNLPGELKEAIKTMGNFNPGMRIQMAVDNMYLLRECQRHIRQEERSPVQKDREEYLKTAERARSIMGSILKDIERGNYGVEEVQNTTLVNLDGLSSAFHKSKQ